jgi:lipopolysaccharide transport system permease protein
MAFREVLVGKGKQLQLRSSAVKVPDFASGRNRRGYQYHLDLICHLVWRDIALKYKGSVLGLLWSLVPPLCQLLVLAFVFGKVVPLNIEAFPVFVFSALLPWIWLSTCFSSAGSLFLNNRSLVRSSQFVPSLLAIVNTLSNLIHYLMFLPILFVMLALYGRPFTPALIALPLLLVIEGVLIVGLSLIIATLNVFYRDLQHVMDVALMFLFYLIPVFYQRRGVDESYQTLFALNPIEALIQSYRDVLFYGAAPKLGPLLFASLTSIVLLGVGYLVYKRQVHDVIDAI